MPLYLTDSDVEQLLPARDAVDLVVSLLQAGDEEHGVRSTVRLSGGDLVTLAGAIDSGETAGASLAIGNSPSVVILASAASPRAKAIVEATSLRALRVAATSAIAAQALARSAPGSLGVIGCGNVGVAHVRCLELVLPSIERVVVYCRDGERRRQVATELGAEAAEYGTESAECDVVVTATTSPDPVLRGEWLQPGALVCATGATTIEARELDNVVLGRAAFVCCDSIEQARIAAGDLAEPVDRGVLDWLEVHELAETLASGHPARQSEDDIVVFKAVGTAGLDLALAAVVVDRARETGAGREL